MALIRTSRQICLPHMIWNDLGVLSAAFDAPVVFRDPRMAKPAVI